jgi:hypothetical protein
MQLRKHMTGLGTRKTQDSVFAMRAMSFVCLLLLVLLTFVQVGHVHPTATDADHCPVCVVMHSAAPVDLVTPAPAVVAVSAPVAMPVAHAVVRLWHCTLFNRPPPTQV